MIVYSYVPEDYFARDGQQHEYLETYRLPADPLLPMPGARLHWRSGNPLHPWSGGSYCISREQAAVWLRAHRPLSRREWRVGLAIDWGRKES